MEKLGTLDIPTEYSKDRGKAQAARTIIAELTPSKADLYEFADKSEAVIMRSMIMVMAQIKWGERGHIGTRIIGNTLYVWEKHPEKPSLELNRIASAEIT